MESVINKPIVLQLNQSWQAIGFRSVKQAVIALTGEADNGTPPALAMDLDVGSDGNLSSAIPTKWEDWVKLPVREQDLSIMTQHGPIRAPTVIICPNYNKMPVWRPRLTKGAIYSHYRGQCAYSGKQLSRKEATIDHVLPKSRGGKDTWENQVPCHRDINFRKGNKTNAEAGLRLLYTPKAPPAMPVSVMINEARHPHWGPFLTTKS